MIEYENLKESNKMFLREFVESFQQTLGSGWFILGESVRRFEGEFAGFLGVQHCAGVASGLDAMILSLKALGIPEGSEVLVPSNTYIATVLAPLHCRLVPVLVEPDPATCNIDPGQIERAITPKTRAMILVHLYGKSCDMDPIMSLAQKHHLKVIEDCAQSHGARYRGRLTGTFGDVSAFSFYPTKNLGALGDAGAVVTNDAAVDAEVRKLRNYGSSQKYYNEVIGYNSRLDELQAGFLSVKLRKLRHITDHKRALADIYHTKLDDRFQKPVVHPDFLDVFHIYSIRHNDRDAVREYLLKHGVKTEVHYPVPPHQQKALKPLFQGASYPVSEEIHRTTLSLPISFAHTPDDIMSVVDILNKFQSR